MAISLRMVCRSLGMGGAQANSAVAACDGHWSGSLPRQLPSSTL